MLNELPFGSHYQGAFIPAPTIGNSQTDYRTRAVIARIGLTANTPFEAVYWMYTVDSAGRALTGAKKQLILWSLADSRCDRSGSVYCGVLQGSFRASFYRC